MRKFKIIFFPLFTGLISFSQAKYHNISSNILGEDRELKILLPRSYSEDDDKAYPVIYEFDGSIHCAMPAHAIPKALESIFFIFQPITKKEYNESILKLEGSPVVYLEDKYAEIQNLFGIEKQIIINDFKAVAAAIKKKQKWEYYEELSKLARDNYPETVLSKYYKGLYLENIGESKKAMKTFQSGYILEEIGGITKDLMLEKAEAIKKDFGYKWQK